MWKNFLNVKFRRISLSIKLLKANDFDLSCIDFHCYPNILLKINKNYPQFSQEEIKKTIWYNRSSLNFRKKYDFVESMTNGDINRYIYIWKIIEKYAVFPHLAVAHYFLISGQTYKCALP